MIDLNSDKGNFSILSCTINKKSLNFIFLTLSNLTLIKKIILKRKKKLTHPSSKPSCLQTINSTHDFYGGLTHPPFPNATITSGQYPRPSNKIKWPRHHTEVDDCKFEIPRRTLLFVILLVILVLFHAAWIFCFNHLTSATPSARTIGDFAYCNWMMFNS